MQRGRVLNLSGFNKLIKFVIKNKNLLILTFFFIVGFCVSVLSFGKWQFALEMSENFLNDFIDDRTSIGFISIFINSFFNSILILFFFFIIGSTMFGTIIVPVALFIYGSFYGSFSAILYSEYLLKGIAFHSVLVLPSSIFIIIAIILAAMESVNFSLKIARLTFSQTMPQNLSFDFKMYCGRYLILIIPIVFSSGIDGLLSSKFLESFNIL